MLEHLNLLWFSWLNAAAGLHGWPLQLGLFIAERVILLVPLGLVLLWMSGDAARRAAAVKALAAISCALAGNAMIGLAWYHARPFVVGAGHAFMRHAPDSSFPSDHGTVMFTAARRFGMALLPLACAVAWSRIFLGIHWPMDMLGALGMAVGAALVFRTGRMDALCTTLAASLATLYRRVLAVPIARGWLRP
jgi:undecaprenyl-diphosphatase